MKRYRVFTVLGFMAGFIFTRISYTHSVLDRYENLDVVIATFFVIITLYLLANEKKFVD